MTDVAPAASAGAEPEPAVAPTPPPGGVPGGVAAGVMEPALRALPLEALHDVELHVEVVLGRARLRLQELLDVRPGQAVELDRARNAPVDVLVNGTLFARGDIVVIDDTNLGVRVSEIIGADLGKDGH